MARIHKTRVAKTSEDEDIVPATGEDSVAPRAEDIAEDIQAGENTEAVARIVAESVDGSSECTVFETGEDSLPPRVEGIQAGPSPQSVARIAEESVAGSSEDPVAGVVEAAMARDFEILEELGNARVKAAESAVSSFSESFQLFAAEATDYSKKCFESRVAFVGELIGAKTLGNAIQIQTGYAKLACAHFLAHLVKLNDLYNSPLKKASEPVEIAKTEVAKL